MKRFVSLTVSLTLIAGLAIVSPGLAEHSSDQYSNSANIVSVELVGKKPIPTMVTWVQSENAEDGDVVLDHFEVVVLDEDDIEIGRISVASDTYSLELNKKNIPQMKVFSQYKVQVDEVYTDSTISEGYDEYFYTAPPKLKNVRVVDKEIANDELNITLKWREPTNLVDESLYYDYKISNVGEPDELILEDDEYSSSNRIFIYDLPIKSMQIQVRARDNHHAGQWSAWKKFNAVVAE